MDSVRDFECYPTSAVTKRIENKYSRYSPLSTTKSEIRLAYLLPGSLSEPLKVHVHSTRHPWNDQHDDWTALSYTWGPMDETRQILVAHSQCCRDGITDEEERITSTYTAFHVTANLEIALRQLRLEGSGFFVWIDALCINQGDLEERGRQVTMLSDIYSSASQATIWLGCDERTSEGVDKLKLIAKFLQITKDDDAANSRALRSGFHVMEHMYTNLNHLPNKSFAYGALGPPIASFLANPWFSRAWVVQEAWTARFIVLLYGHGQMIDWTAILQGNAYMNACGSARGCGGHSDPPEGRPQEGNYKVAGTGSRGIRGLLAQDCAHVRNKKPLPLLDLIEHVKTWLEAGDKRDLIFAIFGMSVEARLAMYHSPLLTPDYKKPVWRVFSDCTRWYINHYRSLNILGHVTYMRRGKAANLDGQLPSWSIFPSLVMPWRAAGGTISDRTPFNADADGLLDTSLIGNSLPVDTRWLE